MTRATPVRALVATCVGSMILLAPTTAWACPVCGLAGPSDNEWAYAVMSVILSALPLGMIGGTAFWVYRRSTAVHEEPANVSQHQDAVQLRPAGD